MPPVQCASSSSESVRLDALEAPDRSRERPDTLCASVGVYFVLRSNDLDAFYCTPPSRAATPPTKENARFYFGAAARDASSQRYSLSQAGREGRPGTPPRAVEETRHAGDQVTRRAAEEKELSLHR